MGLAPVCNVDEDTDHDGITDGNEGCEVEVDTDGDGVPDSGFYP